MKETEEKERAGRAARESENENERLRLAVQDAVRETAEALEERERLSETVQVM